MGYIYIYILVTPDLLCTRYCFCGFSAVCCELVISRNNLDHGAMAPRLGAPNQLLQSQPEAIEETNHGDDKHPSSTWAKLEIHGFWGSSQIGSHWAEAKMWIRRHHDLQCRELVTVVSNLPKKSSQKEGGCWTDSHHYYHILSDSISCCGFQPPEQRCSSLGIRIPFSTVSSWHPHALTSTLPHFFYGLSQRAGMLNWSRQKNITYYIT